MAPTATRKPPGARQQVEIRLLGGFSATVDGVPIPPEGWPTQRATHLVQLLGLAQGHRLLREQVIDALWPQLDPEAGGANLRKAAHHARHALRSPEAVVLRGGEVALFPGADLEVDAAAFERLAAEALAARDPAACAAAADACRGELLPGSRYETWTDAARTRLRLRHLELLRSARQWDRLAQADPTDEPAHRELMRRELDAGNRAAAIRWYAKLRSALQSSLGVAPHPETEALFDRCVEGLPRERVAFVGRPMELARAAAWVNAPAEQRAGGLVVRGPAGIGKSAFCGQLAEMARARGWRVVNIGAAQPDRPYALVACAVEQLIVSDRSMPEAIGPSARSVLSALSPLAGPAEAPQGPLGRHQVIGAFRRALLAGSADGPVMLQVDDAHLLEAADAEVMLHLVVTGRPVFVVLTSRDSGAPGPLASGLARLSRGGHLETIELGPLPDEEIADLAARAAPRRLTPGLLERVASRAQGNPFAALELARSIDPDANERLPASAHEAIAERLCDVDDATLSLLKSMALAGDEFDTVTAVALDGGGEEHAYALLDRALASGVLVVNGARYRFRHDLVRQALVEQIPPHHRLKMHRLAAERLQQHEAPPAVIARHWLAGGSPAQAAPWLLAAARRAANLGAFRDVLAHLEPLLEWNASHPEALRLRAEALEAVGDPAAVAAYRAAAEAAPEPESHDLRAKGALAQIKQGDPRGALRALEGVRPSSVEGRLCEALTYSGAAAMGVVDPAMGTAKSAEARRLALEAGDTTAIVVASWAQAAAAHARGELHGSVWADLQDTQHLPHMAVRVFDGQLCIMQRFLYGARPYAEVIDYADRLAAEARRLGAARGYAFGVTLRGEAELLAGDLDAAEEHLALGGRLHRAIGGATGEALSLQRRAEIALHRGRPDAAAALLDEALDLARQTDIGFHLFDRIYGTRMTLRDDPAWAQSTLEDALEAVRGPLETCPGCRITFAVPAAIAAARAGQVELAEEYERSVEYLANVVMQLPAWYAALDEVRAHVARARGEDDATVGRYFAAAAQRFHEAGHPLDARRCEACGASGAGPLSACRATRA